MAKRFRLPFFGLLALLLMLAGVSARPLQQVTGEGDWYFPETQQTVSGEFLDFYSKTQDYLIKFGYPISGVESHPILPGVQVQYFQRARLELYPNEPTGSQVRIASLGVWLYDGADRGEPADLPFTSGACRLFTQNSIAVCYEFLRFYDSNQGPVYFGEPISPLEETTNGRLVQYFERARMEWWPENPSGSRVVLTELGSIYYNREHQASGASTPAQAAPAAPAVQSEGDDAPVLSDRLKVCAFTAKPLVSANGTQTVYVVVTDPSAQPVKGAQVMLTVRLPQGQSVNHRLTETQANGLSQGEIAVGELDPNQIVRVDVLVTAADGSQSSTRVYFRVWW